MNISSTLTHTRSYNTLAYTSSINSERLPASTALFSMKEQSFSFSGTAFELQNSLSNNTVQQNHEAFQSFLNDIGYNGQPLAELSQEEAAALVSDEGFFGISQTAERIANFVISGSGSNENLLRAGREGMLQGFKEAEEIWGSELPEISQKTMALATKMVDDAMHALGYSILNEAI